VFVGDECFGRIDYKFETKEDILATVSITDAAAIRILKDFLSNDVYRQMCQCIDKLADSVFDRTKEIPDARTKSDFLYLDQRIAHFMMPWREYFTAQVGFVHDPILDGTLLEFMNRLPHQLRKKKFLYRNIVRKMFPDLFTIKLAASTGYHVDWYRELQKHKGALHSIVRATDSRLGEIIPKSQVLKAIDRHGSWILKIKEYSIKAFMIVERNKFVDKVIRLFFGRLDHPKGRLVSQEKLLIRLLLIWLYLSPPSSDP
jgi:asparagine synthase (glutamine-hydrolysing)